MKKIFKITVLASFFFATSTALAQELGEFCWKERNSSCTLKLNVTQVNNAFSFIGNEICPDVARTSHATGSGFISGNQLKLGLNFIAQEPGTDPAIPLTYQYGFFGTIDLSNLSLNGMLDVLDEPANYDAAAC